MPVWLSIVLAVLSIVIPSASSIIAVRYVLPKYNPIIRKIMSYDAGLVFEPNDWTETTLKHIDEILYRCGAYAKTIDDDFGNGVVYKKAIILSNNADFTYDEIRSELTVFNDGLCKRAFVTHNGKDHDKQIILVRATKNMKAR